MIRRLLYLLFLTIYIIFLPNGIVAGSNVNSKESNYLLAPLSTISIFAWLDFNEDGIRQSGENGVGGITLQLYDEFNNLRSTGTTNTDGIFVFNAIPNGKYRVKFDKFAGLTYTYQNKGNDENNDSDVDLTGYSDYLTINTPGDYYSLTSGYKGNLQVFIGNNISICKGSSATLNATPYFGLEPFQYNWDNGLGSGRTKTVAPLVTTTYKVTVSDNWGFTAESEITVRVKNGVGQEKHYVIDDFRSGSHPPATQLQVNPLSPGPKNTIDYSLSGILGNSRDVEMQFISGVNPSSLQINYGDGYFSHSNDVGSISRSKLRYHNGTSLNFDISEFQYLKFKDVAIDQGEVFFKITMIDNANRTASTVLKLPGLGTSVVFDKDVFFEDLPGMSNIDKTALKEMYFEFNSDDSSIDFRIGDIWFCNFTDCPVVSDPRDMSMCLGDSVTIGANVACSDLITFLWDQNLGYGKRFKVSPPSTTTYNVTVIDAYGCTASDHVTVTVYPIPSVSLPADIEFCQQDSVIITANVTGGTQPYSYIWSNGATTKSIKVSPSANTFYSVTVSDVNNCKSNEASINVKVNPKPTLVVSSNLADCAESNGSATAVATGGTPPYTYVWNTGFVGDVLINIPAGNYYVTVTDSKGCSDTKTASVGEKDCGLIGNQVWEDLNYNGIQESGESGISNVQVILYNDLYVPKDTVFTDNSGQYYFFGLKEGNYYVKFIKPSGYYTTKQNIGNDQTDSDADLISGYSHLIQLAKYEKDSTIDAGFYKLASIGDTVWVDVNGNGLQDNAEPGLGGFSVQLLDCNDAILATTITDQNGKYEFKNLNPGYYKVRFLLNGNYKFTLKNIGSDINKDSDANTIDGKTACEELISGENNVTYDAGVYIPAQIGNFVWEDLNANGIQETGETGIKNVAVILNDCNGTPIETKYTDNNGFYLFDNLSPGNYKISIVKPAGYFNSPSNVGNDDLDSDINQDGFTDCEVLISGESNLTYDIGLYKPAQIGDKVWLDKNGNGIQENGENGVVNITVKLETCGGNQIQTLLTDVNGNYLFGGLTPGSYRIKFELPADYYFTKSDIGSDLLDSDPNPTDGITICESLISGESNLTYDAGIYKLGALGDKVWLDENGNGIQDINEPGFENVEVQLQNCNGTILDTKYTDPNGLYLFNNLVPDQYRIKFIPPLNYSFTKENFGSDDKDSDPLLATGLTVCEDIESGESNLTYDAGLVYFGSLGNYVWEDINGDGIQQPNEPAKANVEIRLYRWFNNAFIFDKSTQTNAQGFYIFEDLAPGNYYIKVILPSGYETTISHAGSNDEIDSDADNSNGIGTTMTINLSPGEDDMTWDFGIFRCATIGDLIWNDMFRNNIYDVSEGGIDGVLVRLWRKDGNNWTLWDQTYTSYNPNSTCGSGYWSFCTNPGEYYIQVVSIENSGYIHCTPNVGNNESIDSDITDAFGMNTTNSFVLVSGDNFTNIDFGFFKQLDIKGQTWIDANGDGIRAGSEAKLAGITVQLFNSNGPVDTRTTDSQGKYEFLDVQPNAYYLKFSLPSNYVFTLPNVGSNDNVDSDVTHDNGANTTAWFTLLDQSANFMDAGYKSTGSMPFGFNGINGVNMENYNLISWRTKNDDDVSRFEVLRNIGSGEIFNLIEMVNSNRSDKNYYQINDFDVTKIGTYRYKIKAIVADSNVYSNEVLIDVNMNLGYSIFPNPVSSILNFEYVGMQDESISYLITDLYGKVYVNSKSINVKSGQKYSSEITDLYKLPSGVYQFILKVRDEALVSKFIKINE